MLLSCSRTTPSLGLHLVRKCSTFQIHQGAPEERSKTPQPATVVVFGFGGSPKAQAEKISDVYTEQGHRTLYCVLPQMLTFTYDVKKIVECAGRVVGELEKQGAEEVVCHSLSNNGSVLYQQFTQLVKEQGKIQIKVT